ncbi:MAG: hypothetical protein KDD53_12560, partial [Bdellovibrionales bacterium]|nr:hypothetical protein [Bdellovibrionales bacterium]
MTLAAKHLSEPTISLERVDTESQKDCKEPLSVSVDDSSIDIFSVFDWFLPLFGIANFVLFELLLRVEYLQQIEGELRQIYAPVQILLLFLISGELLVSLWRASLKSGELGRPPLGLQSILALLALSVGFLSIFLADSQEFQSYGITESFFAVALLVWVRANLQGRLLAKQDFLQRYRIQDRVKRVRQLLTVPDKSVVRPLTAEELRQSVIEDQRWVPVGSIVPKNIVRVLPDEIVGFDGVVVSGQAEVIEVRLSGRGMHRFKSVGDRVFAGSRVLGGVLDLQVEALFDDASITFAEGVQARLVESFTPRLKKMATFQSLWFWG